MSIEIIKYPLRKDWEKIIKRPAIDNTSLFESVNLILEDIRLNGDRAVAAYSEKFDKVVLDCFSVSPDEMDDAAQ